MFPIDKQNVYKQAGIFFRTDASPHQFGSIKEQKTQLPFFQNFIKEISFAPFEYTGRIDGRQQAFTTPPGTLRVQANRGKRPCIHFDSMWEPSRCMAATNVFRQIPCRQSILTISCSENFRDSAVADASKSACSRSPSTEGQVAQGSMSNRCNRKCIIRRSWSLEPFHISTTLFRFTSPRKRLIRQSTGQGEANPL